LANTHPKGPGPAGTTPPPTRGGGVNPGREVKKKWLARKEKLADPICSLSGDDYSASELRLRKRSLVAY